MLDSMIYLSLIHILIIECSMDVSPDAVCEQMGRTPPWIGGLNLRADGYETMFYKKD